MEWSVAIRSRRAIVVTLLFVAVAGLVMYGTVSVFASIETELLETLKLPSSGSAGSVSVTLWKSPAFARIIEHFVGNSLVFADIRGRHPMLLAYAMFVFQIVPMLTLMVSAPKIADDVRSGAARYWLVRVTRTEWSLGKFLGEALTLASAMAVGALAAWGILLFRLPAANAAPLLPGILDWSLRAWVYAFSWLGLFLGLSHIVKSGGKATALSVLAMIGAAAWTPMLNNLIAAFDGLGWLSCLDVMTPQASWTLLWRRSPAVLLQGVVQLSALAFFYLALGAAVFRRRDI